MKNAIIYYYNLNPTEIHQINKNYRFNIQNYRYLLFLYERSIEELKEIYKLYMFLNSVSIYCHKIILNKNNNIITNINGASYVLLNIEIENQKITYNDIMYLQRIPIPSQEYKHLLRTNWKTMWTNKVDYIEYQISQFGKKYPIIRESIDYYIGIIENCIALLNYDKDNKNIVVSHRRTEFNTTTEEFYNPFTFILDARVRDISEYIKSTYNQKYIKLTLIEKYIQDSNLTNNEIIRFFTRLIYPSKYVDTYEKIINGYNSEEIINNIVKDVCDYEKLIKEIYYKLSTFSYIPEIEWIKKT